MSPRSKRRGVGSIPIVIDDFLGEKKTLGSLHAGGRS